jgi:hypothetical protein
MLKRHVRNPVSLPGIILTVIFDTVRKAVLGMMAMRRMSVLASHHLTPEHKALEEDLFKYKQESEKVPSPLLSPYNGSPLIPTLLEP